MAIPFETYSMAGIKEEFAEWVSNISPEYTPFISMIAKFPVKNTRFQWQQDTLADPDTANAVVEGDSAAGTALTPTVTKESYTQIMRKVVMVTDTANAVTSYGREKELFYQLKKAAKELKRDQESIFLLETNGSTYGSATVARKTKSLGEQIDSTLAGTTFDWDSTGATAFEDSLFGMTSALYTAGAEPTILMYNPAEAKFFAALQESTGTRMRIFENDKRFVKQVETIVDPLGQEFRCVPNRWVAPGLIYCFNPADLGQATLRAPQRIKLAKDGSYEKYMIEQEVGLRLNNDKAAALMHVTY